MSDRSPRDGWLLPTLQSLLTPELLARVTAHASSSFWEAAVAHGGLRDDDILRAVAERNHMKCADLAVPNPEMRDALPESLARKYRVVAVAATSSMLDVATADPTDLDCERALEFATGRSVRLMLASPLRIDQVIDELYRPESAIDRILENVTEKYEVRAVAEVAELVDLAALGDRAGERPVIRLVDYIVAEGIAGRASDIHLEPEEQGIAVRYRIDGVLRQAMELPRAAGGPLVSRIKIMSGLDIADRLRPQDGRARVTVNGKPVDLRVSTLPSAHGEKVVVRILDQGATLLSLGKLGLIQDDAARLELLLGLREGVVLVTGPTGSGKTTTLYSALARIKERGVNIVTVEDPVEYRLPGTVQVQVNEKAGLGFAAALRSILRQDPDVVLVGEIRDRETATIAMQASLTGHLVLSTLHTIDAASSVTRLVDIGVEPYKISAALKGVVAQRLVRKLCVTCAITDTAPVSRRVQAWLPADAAIRRPVGCPECGNTGYRGRVAVMEILVADAAVERVIADSGSVQELAAAGRAAGMRTLWEAGMAQAAAGTTSIEELVRVLELPSGDPESLDAATPPARRRTPRPAVGARADAASPAEPAPTVPARAPLFDTNAFRLLDDAAPVDGRSTDQRVLVVDDDPGVRFALRTLLQSTGVTVHEAADGADALAMIDRTAPDLVLLDLYMPVVDGFEMLARLRARPATAMIPVVVMSGTESEEVEERVFALGADDFVTKPFRPRALAARLRALLQRAERDHGAALELDAADAA